MAGLIIDTSAVLACLNGEAGSDGVEQALDTAAMSLVNQIADAVGVEVRLIR